MGVVDYTYRGDNDQWRVPMYATRDVHIDKNTRISQFRIMKNQPPLAFTRVEHLTGPDRGGFGSTGKLGGSPCLASFWPPGLPGGRNY